ncbi:hypothetical protein GCM10025868_16480 [Angustibacter aerolatus]|uniref:Phage holin family protein n=1 Tax=Angustibacter aerolatus TaxID=1162965 RepID=A0ABQ6JE12_9ACTN|nr:hypothetical protein GCM10025868_16480 [Angustibacter aerolatus]
MLRGRLTPDDGQVLLTGEVVETVGSLVSLWAFVVPALLALVACVAILAAGGPGVGFWVCLGAALLLGGVSALLLRQRAAGTDWQPAAQSVEDAVRRALRG